MVDTLDLSVGTVVRYIDSGRIPGRRIGDKGSKARVGTLTSVSELIKYAEQNSKWAGTNGEGIQNDD